MLLPVLRFSILNRLNNKLIDQFVRIITGQFHQRIAYPEAAKAKEKAKAAPADEVEELKPEWVMAEGEAAKGQTPKAEQKAEKKPAEAEQKA